ncbi:Dynamin-A [Colletotrichum sp. SAR11_240]|nr:Dynamin-A [Colletotrichum sp. SAR11_240]
MAEVAFPSPGLFQSDHGGIGLESPTSKGFWDAPSDRTAPDTVSTVRITIAEPEVPDRFGYPEDLSYKDYVYTTDRLGVDDFKRVMDEISTQYMGIRRGKGKGKKNFATQVLRIELSGPSRSHFSILDVPGLISNAVAVNEYEMKAVNKMIDDYMKQPANIVMALYFPGFLDDETMRVRALTRSANESFTQAMKEGGHTFDFEDPDIDPIKELANKMSTNYPPVPPQQSDPTVTPPTTPPRKGRVGQAKGVKDETAASFAKEIQSQLKIWQTTELPGLINTEVIRVLFMKQSELWERIAEEHINEVGRYVEHAADKILRQVCSSSGCEIIQKELSAVIAQFQRQTKERALAELREHCRRERESHLQTTDVRFQQKLQAFRSLRLMKAIVSYPPTQGYHSAEDHWAAIFHLFHHSAEENMVNDVHDVVKVYYEISLGNFIEHVTSNITESFISHETGPLRGLSTKWMFTLTEEEVEKLAREDEHIVQQRNDLDEVIEKLRTADGIVESARTQTRGLSDI